MKIGHDYLSAHRYPNNFAQLETLHFRLTLTIGEK